MDQYGEYQELAKKYRKKFDDVVPLMQLQGVEMEVIIEMVVTALKTGKKIKTGNNKNRLY